MSQKEHDDIAWDFGYHPPQTPARIREHEDIRARFMDLAHEMAELLPAGREKVIVKTKLEEGMYWANAAVARQYPQASIAPGRAHPDNLRNQGVQHGDGNSQNNTFG